MGTKNEPSQFDCYANAEPDEPMFILLARDAYAPTMVRSWATEREIQIAMGQRPSEDIGQVKEARACADAMEAWRAKNR